MDRCIHMPPTATATLLQLTLQLTATKVLNKPRNLSWIDLSFNHLEEVPTVLSSYANLNVLQHAATHCNTLQHALQRAAARYSTLQHTATYCNTFPFHHSAEVVTVLCSYANLSVWQHAATRCNTLQHTATHTATRAATRFNTLQHTATHRNTPQHTATHRNTLSGHHLEEVLTVQNVLQHTATHFRSSATLAAMRCKALQQTATRRYTLQYAATHCNMLQHTAPHLPFIYWRKFRLFFQATPI